ncbi:YkvA family protein [Anaerolentibacter hominis]|uniref:YkvA family protein n=1 Tax=Anaerolentibacter hominis TaxID=3079009 RepID=UPI0031B890F0
MKITERAKKLKQDIPTVFLALKDKDTPLFAKLIAGITVGYALSPIDFIPDFIPVLGYLDDLILLPVLIALTIKLIPEEIWERNRMLSSDMWKDGRPERWYYAIPVIVIWLLVIWMIIKAVWL